MSNKILNNIVVMLDDGDTFSSIKGSVVMLLAPGDQQRLADADGFVEPLDIYDLSDVTDLRRLADKIEGAK
jgi:hypothetical protein